MSKLYTEDQVIKAIQLAQKCEHDCGGVYFYCTEIEEVIEELTPIQLPSDKTTRFEVIDGLGRRLVECGVNIEISMQDDGRTMKVFLTKIKGGQGE